MSFDENNWWRPDDEPYAEVTLTENTRGYWCACVIVHNINQQLGVTFNRYAYGLPIRSEAEAWARREAKDAIACAIQASKPKTTSAPITFNVYAN